MTLTKETVREIASSIRQHELPSSYRNETVEQQDLAARLKILNYQERSGFDEAIDEVQISSKLWLIEELSKVTDVASRQVVVLGAWYGILPLLINWRVARPPERMLCIDIDPVAVLVGKRVIGPLFGNVDYRVADAMTFDYKEFNQSDNSIVINTVCEHLPRFAAWWAAIPKGQLVVLQSNDYFICPDHVNAVESLDELKAQAPMSDVLFEGALPLLKWHRFMLIGSK